MQPWFSANYLEITLGRPVDGGGIAAGSTVEIRLNGGGLFQLVGLVEQMHTQAMERMRAEREHNTLRGFLFLPVEPSLLKPIASQRCTSLQQPLKEMRPLCRRQIIHRMSYLPRTISDNYLGSVPSQYMQETAR